MLIDDNTSLADAMAGILRMEDYYVTVVNNGELALKQVEMNTPDLVITDLLMPKLSGIELIKRLRAQNRFQKLPIIALTADTRDSRCKEGLEAGANLFFTKPFDDEELLTAIKKLLESEPS